MSRHATPLLVALLAVPAVAQTPPASPVPPCVPPTGKCLTGGSTSQNHDRIRYFEYFLAAPKDSAECSARVENGSIVFAAPVTNGAMTCPDAFLEALHRSNRTGVWKNWASDDQHGPPALQSCTGTVSDTCWTWPA